MSAAIRRTSFAWPITLASVLSLAFVSEEALPVVLPLLAIVGLAVAVTAHLYRSDGQLPVFDLGVLTILITSLYSAIPLLGFWLAGLQWTSLTYLPLYQWNPSAVEVGEFSLRHVLYLYSFSAAYLVFRGRVPIRTGPVRKLAPTQLASIALCGAAVMLYLWLLQYLFDYSYDPSYSGLTLESAAASAARIPYVIRQISHNVFAIFLIIKFCALVWLMSHWRNWKWRSVLFVWLFFEGLATVNRMGARTYFVMLVMAAALLYHRLVKPLAVARAAVVVALILGGALLYGFSRDLGGGLAGLNRIANATSSRWATMNEFQALYGIAYDLHARKEAGALGPIPWQIHVSDIVLLVPSQILPFSKAEQCGGYPVVDGIGLGCVLGVISQAVVGLDFIELAVRGLGLGFLFALIHRWYARRQDDYWATTFYLCLCLWCYYTFRGSTFFFVYFVVYSFLPLLVGVQLVQLLVRLALRAAEACGV